MSTATALRHNAGFQYRLRFFHKCRSLGAACDPGQIDRFQVQGCALESTCGAPIIVVLVRYRHDPESGLSRECQRAQFSPSAPPFAVKVVVVPADQVLAYMDQPLLQQPRLVDAQGRNLIEGPDVSPDGSIYVTPLAKNGIAHLNNFCMAQPYIEQCGEAASGCGLGVHPHVDGCCGGAQRTTHRVRSMLGPSVSDGGVLGSASEMIPDPADVLNSSGELCVLVQLLRHDPQRPGKWFAYDMPHLVSRPFQVVPRSALPALLPSAGPSPVHQLSRGEPLTPGRVTYSARRSIGQGLGMSASVGREPLQPHPQPFMSPQYKRGHGAPGYGPVPTAGLAAYASGPGLPTRMSAGVMGAPTSLDSSPSGCLMVGREPTMAGGISMAMEIGVGAGSAGGMGASPGVLQAACSPTAVGGSPGAGGGPGAAGGSYIGERGGQSSMSTESPSAVAGSQRTPRARRRSCLSKDSSHDDGSVGAPMTTSGATAVGGLRTPSITSGADPGTTGAMRAAAQQAAVAAAAAAAAAAATADLAFASPPFSPPPSRLMHMTSAGVGLGPTPLDAATPVSLRGSEEGRSAPLQLRQAPSSTLLDMNISELLNDIQPQPLLTEDMMELEEGPPKRVRSNTTTSDVAAFMSDNTSSQALTGSPKWIPSPLRHTDAAYKSRSGHTAVVGRSAGGSIPGGDVGGGAPVSGNAFMQFEGHASRTDSWSTDMPPEQLLDLRKQSTGFSGTHFAVANVSSSAPCSGPAPEQCGPGAAAGGAAAGCAAATYGGASGGSSASQLELLVQLLGQPGAMQDAMDRMDLEQLERQEQLQQQEQQ